MNCAKARKLLALYPDGLSEKQAREVASHLETCPRCRAEWEKLRRALEGLRSLPEVEVSDDFDLRVLQAAQAGWSEEFAPPYPLLWRFAFVSGLVLALLMGGAHWLSSKVPPVRPSATVAERARLPEVEAMSDTQLARLRPLWAYSFGATTRKPLLRDKKASPRRKKLKDTGRAQWPMPSQVAMAEVRRREGESEA